MSTPLEEIFKSLNLNETVEIIADKEETLELGKLEILKNNNLIKKFENTKIVNNQRVMALTSLIFSSLVKYL